MSNCKSIIKLLIENYNVDINVTLKQRKTLLHVSAEFGHLDLTEWLLSKGVNVNDTDEYGLTPLHYAAKNKHLHIISALNNNGADIIVPDESVKLHIQMQNVLTNVETLQLLIKRKEGFGGQKKFGEKLLSLVCNFGYLSSIKYLINHGVDVNATSENGCTPLHVAANYSQADVVKFLLDSKADVHRVSNDGDTALHKAALRDNLVIIQLLIGNGADVNAVNKDKYSPLHIASMAGNYKVVELLIAKGAKVTCDIKGKSALFYAIEGYHTKTFRLLLNNCADINATNIDGYTLLEEASLRGNLKIMEMLIQSSSRAHLNDCESRNYLTLVAGVLSNKKQAVEMLLNNRADVNLENEAGWTALHTAAMTGHVDILKLLIERNADFKADKVVGYTPLHLAVLYGHEEIVEVLVKKFGRTDEKDRSERTALHFATMLSISANSRVVDVLLHYNANVNATDNRNRTPLHYASLNGAHSVVQKLLDRNARVDIKSVNLGTTALHEASSKGHTRIMHLLLKSNADMVDVKDSDGSTSLLFASGRGHVGAARWLLKNGANVNITAKNGDTVLHQAVIIGDFNMVNLLLNYGAEINALTTDNCTSFQFSASNGHQKIAQLLIKRGAKVNENDSKSFSSFFTAVHKGHVSVVDTLLRHGTDVNAFAYGTTALHIAAEFGHCKIAEILLKNRANAYAMDERYECTPLHWAIIHKQHEIIKIFYKHKINMNVTDRKNRTPLQFAADYGYTKCVINLLIFGANAKAVNNQLYTALHLAALKGHSETVKAILNHQLVLEFVDFVAENGHTALHLAVLKNNLKIASTLVKAGANVNIAPRRKAISLHIAIMVGNLEMVKLFMEAGAELSSNTEPNSKVFSTLHLAVQFNNPNVKFHFVNADKNRTENRVNDELSALDTKLVISSDLVLPDHNVVVIALDEHSTALLNAVHNKHILRVILDHVQNRTDRTLINERDSRGDTPLMVAAKTGNAYAAELLLNCDEIDINVQNANGYSALHYAVLFGHLNVIQILLTFKAIVNHKNCKHSVLGLALFNPNIDIIKVLIQHGADVFADINKVIFFDSMIRNNDILILIVREIQMENGEISDKLKKFVNASNIYGTTLLMSFAMTGNVLGTQMLLECNGIEIDKQNDKGITALHFAFLFGNFEVAKILIENGADVFAMNDHDSVLHQAIKSDEILGLVLKEMRMKRYGDELKSAMNAADGEGDTPLMWAVEQGNLSAAKLLLECDEIDVNKRNLKGWTALHWAAHVGHVEIAHLLINNNADAKIKDENRETAFAIASNKMSGDEKYEHVAALILSIMS